LSRLLALALAIASTVTVDAGRQPPPSITALITTYAAGQYDEAVRRAATIEDLSPLRLRFVQDVPAWIRSEPALVDKRRAAAAAFLLELTHARLETDWGRLDDLIEFACVDLRTVNPASPFELAWHRASVALAGRARARLWLLGPYPQLPHQPPRRRAPPAERDPSPKHLKHALERFPEDPTLRLDLIAAWMWGRDDEPARNTRRLDFALSRSTVLQEAIVSLQPLVDEATVGAEALVRIAQVQFASGEPDLALETLRRAQPREGPPAIRFLSFFSAGRALEALGRPKEAVEAYLRALEIVPGAESASIALASLEFVTGDREKAVSLFSQAFAKPITVADPGRVVGYGSFMHWPHLKQAMRAELPK
jgi:tetratricopeptide (TPR) repeat protein